METMLAVGQRAKWHISTQLLRTASSISTWPKNRSATATRASAGHSVYQSMVQQFTSEGNLIHSAHVQPRDLHGFKWI